MCAGSIADMPGKESSSKLTSIEGAERLAALYSYDILEPLPLGTLPQVALDDLTQLAAQLCQTPVSLVTVMDSEFQYFTSCFGVEMATAPLEKSLCSIVVAHGKPLIVPDTHADVRLEKHPAVIREGIRFYAGIPLITPEGYVIGTICVLDFVPRVMVRSQIDSLQALARQVMNQLQLRRTARKLEQVTHTLTAVSCGVAATVGDTFFASLVQHFTQALNVDYSYIALLSQDGSKNGLASEPADGLADGPGKHEYIKHGHMEALSVSHQGELVERFEYNLPGTPCEQILRKGSFGCYGRDLQALFPEVSMLVPLGIESYAAVPIRDVAGMPLGVLAIMDTKPLETPHLVESLLTLFSVRIATELERQRAESKQSELLMREYEARQQAETANRIKDEFLAVISHELRSPMHPIVGWSQLLRQGNLGPEKTKTALSVIERNALLQVKLIDDLLDISRILRGKLSLHRVPVRLSAVIIDALETVKLDIERKSIQLRWAVSSVVDTVMGDVGRLQQIVWNLLSNAVKFTPEGGQITVGLTAEEGFAKIQIIDTGKGISAEFLPNVFEHFRQEDYSTTRQFGGLGLGLAIVQRLVELHGGHVSVESLGEGKGATFTVKIPLMIREPELATVQPAMTQNDLKAFCVLVIDDEVDSREMTAMALTQVNANVITVASGSEALRLLHQGKLPDILISDIAMPEMDGYQLMETIRALPAEQGGNIPAIALTACAAEVDQQRALAVGFQHYLSKPININHLITMVGTLLLVDG